MLVLPMSIPNGQVWNLDSNLIVPDDGKTSFYYNMISNVRAKSNENFPTQIVSSPLSAVHRSLLD